MCKNDHDRKDEKSRPVVGMGGWWGSGSFNFYPMEEDGNQAFYPLRI